MITILGTGAAGDDNNDGIEIGGMNALVSTMDGAIRIDGTGGSNGTADSDDNNGVRIDTGTLAVESTGTGTIDIDGTGAAGDDANRGVFITGATSQISGVNGDITITGTGNSNGGADSDDNDGVRIDTGGLAVTTSGDGSITLTGTGGAGDDSNRGVTIMNFGTQVTATAAATSPSTALPALAVRASTTSTRVSSSVPESLPSPRRATAPSISMERPPTDATSTVASTSPML